MAVTDVDLVDQDHPRQSPTRDEAQGGPHALPLHGLEAFVRRAGRPEARDRRGQEAQARTTSPSGRPRPSSRCASRASRASSTRSSRSEYGELSRRRSRASAPSSPSPKLLDDVIVMELEDIRAQVRRQAPHRDRRQRGRDQRRGPHPGRGHGRHHLARRLHQADEPAATTAPRSAAARGASGWRRARRTG